MNFPIPPYKKQRVIVNTDAKNEADDQYAIVHAILTPSFELHGIIATHNGVHKGRPTDTASVNLEEVHLLLRLMDLDGQIRVELGAKSAIADGATPRPSAGAEFIIEEAMKDDPRPLNILFYGPLTDMASAILMEPKICERDLHVIWIGGSDTPEYSGREYNLFNDVEAANVVMRSSVAMSQVPSPLYRYFSVSHAELMERVWPHGPLGEYLVRQLIEFNAGNQEYRTLGDSPAVGVLMAPNAGKWSWQVAPEYDPETGEPIRTGKNRRIRVYETFDARFLMEDFYAKLAQFARKQAAK